ncbi:MAG: hypothetical protein KF906_02420 [Actinobacteria bacterium]|nr:hypothetical protein [Actinomycetota bacterium]
MTVDVRRATEADLDSIVEVLTSSLIDHPAIESWFPPDDRRGRLADSFRMEIVAGLAADDVVVVAGDPVVAAAHFQRTANGTLDLEPSVVWAIHGDRSFDLLQWRTTLDQHHPPHDWRLAVAATASHARRRGVATEVLRFGLASLDEQGGSCAFETVHPEVLPACERQGFRPTAEIDAPFGRTWLMYRPRSQDTPTS